MQLAHGLHFSPQRMHNQSAIAAKLCGTTANHGKTVQLSTGRPIADEARNWRPNAILCADCKVMPPGRHHAKTRFTVETLGKSRIWVIR